MLKKISAMLIALTLSVCVFTGCGNSSSNSDSDSSSSSSASSSDSSSEDSSQASKDIENFVMCTIAGIDVDFMTFRYFYFETINQFAQNYNANIDTIRNTKGAFEDLLKQTVENIKNSRIITEKLFKENNLTLSEDDKKKIEEDFESTKKTFSGEEDYKTQLLNAHLTEDIFKQNLDEIAMLMAYEVSKDFPLKLKDIETPVCKTTGYEVDKQIVLVPILRAGIGLVDGFRTIMPNAKIGHIGMYRDEETLIPHEYYARFPSGLESSKVIIVDPMLATGGSAMDAIKAIKDRGAKDIMMVCFILLFLFMVRVYIFIEQMILKKVNLN